MKTSNKIIKRYHYILVLIGLTFSSISCISPFELSNNGDENLLVVDGSLIKGQKTQIIKISRSSSISLPRFNPEENCQVKILDDVGNEFVFTEESKGKYIANIDDTYLKYNNQYKLIFSTISGENYESEFQKLLKTPPIDSAYYLKESIYILDSLRYIEGLQFYVDLNAPDDAEKYYRWQIEETSELHARWKISGVYDGNKVTMNNYPTDSLYYCWNTKFASGIYTSSTNNLSHNVIKKRPLHHKLRFSKDLMIKYRATIRQFALNKDAYNYWNQKESELNNTDQIYTTQPKQIKSNIFNTKNPDEKILGFFWVSSLAEKQLFLENPFGKIDDSFSSCKTVVLCSDLIGNPLENVLLNLIKKTKNIPKPPIYIYYSFPNCYNVDLTNECIDCRLQNGTTQKPDFWE